MDDPSRSASILGLMLSGGLSFYFALVETAIVALPRERVKEWKSQSKTFVTSLETLIENRKKLIGFLDFFQVVFASLYFFSLTLFVMGLGFIPTGFTLFPLGGHLIFGTGVIVYIALFQFFPRRLGQFHVEKLSRRLGPSLAYVFKLFRWIDPGFDGFSKMLALPFGKEPEPKKPLLSEGEIKMLVTLGKEDQLEIEEEEKEMIASVVTFGQTIVKEIMIPRIDMICVDAQTPLSGVMDTAISHGYSKYPVYEGTPDNIIGVVYVKDLLRLLRNGSQETSLKEIARKAFFVPESKKVDDLLRDMQKEKISMAIVVDEYGGTDGLVTIEDLVEEIVGEIEDEHDTDMPDVFQLGENSWLVNGQINVEDLNAQLGLNLPTEEFETLGGYVYGLLGKVPRTGEKVETPEATLEVAVVHRQRISKIKLIKKNLEMTSPQKEELS